jgi:5-(carboxyamino)imidazole ribonucleotide mutase
MKKVGILMGSDSDLPVVQKGTAILKELEIPFEVHVYSAHRTPEQARKFCSEARENGFGVLICAAGKAATTALSCGAIRAMRACAPPQTRHVSSAAQTFRARLQRTSFSSFRIGREV